MKSHITIGTDVGWQWGNGLAIGKVIETYPHRHELTTKGKVVVRNGSEDDPAVVIEQENGTLVLKLAHEVKNLRASE